jgi:hypothetical protein
VKSRWGGGSTFLPYFEFAYPVIDRNVVGGGVQRSFGIHVSNEELTDRVKFGGVVVTSEYEFSFGGTGGPVNVFWEWWDGRRCTLGLSEVFTVAGAKVSSYFVWEINWSPRSTGFGVGGGVLGYKESGDARFLGTLDIAEFLVHEFDLLGLDKEFDVFHAFLVVGST